MLGLRPFDVQLIGGMILHAGQIAEMRTGEGKTLVAVLPAYLNALSGKGVQAGSASSRQSLHACPVALRAGQFRQPQICEFRSSKQSVVFHQHKYIPACKMPYGN